MGKAVMGAMGVQGVRQNRTCLAVKIASLDLPSVKLATYKLSQQGEPLYNQF